MIGLSAVLLGAHPVPASDPGATAEIKTAKVAETLANRCANVRHGELVLIEGGTRDQQLLEDLAVEIRKLGAHPLIVLGSDRLTRNLVTEVPEELDDQEPEFGLKLADMIDAIITVDFSERPDLLADVPASRLQKRMMAIESVYDRMLERGVLQVHLGNGLYPTDARARQFGVPQEKLAGIFWDGVLTDYDELQASGDRVRTTLAAGSTLRITSPNGTDLTVDISRRPVFVSDGVISSEDRYAGGPKCAVWLPAGEVYLAPVPGTARGTFVADRFFFEGKSIEKLTLEFEKGRLVSMDGRGVIGALRERYEAAPEGRDVFAFVDVGINRKVQAPPDSRMVTWMAAGTISIGTGNNVWAGGANDVAYNLFAHLLDGTLTVDGKTLVESGRLLEPR